MTEGELYKKINSELWRQSNNDEWDYDKLKEVLDEAVKEWKAINKKYDDVQTNNEFFDWHDNYRQDEKTKWFEKWFGDGGE